MLRSKITKLFLISVLIGSLKARLNGPEFAFNGISCRNLTRPLKPSNSSLVRKSQIYQKVDFRKWNF